MAIPAQGAFVAVGTGFNAPYAQSPNGTAWSVPTSNVFSYLQGAAYGANTYVAVGWSGAVYTSPDAVAWTPRSSGASGNFLNVAFGRVSSGSLFAAVGAGEPTGTPVGAPPSSQTQFIYTSPDGITWTPRSAGGLGQASGPGVTCAVVVCIGGCIYVCPPSGTIYDIAWGDPGGVGTFVAVGPTGVAYRSTDGAVWEPVRTGGTDTLYGVAWGNGRFMAVGVDTTMVPHILSSPDGRTWTVVGSGAAYQYYWDVAYGNGAWVVTGYPSVLRSTTGTSWSTISTRHQYTYQLEVMFGGGRFVAYHPWYYANGTSMSVALSTSVDGIDWQMRPVNAAYWYGMGGVGYGPKGFVGVGYSMVRSPDGLDWIHINGMPGYQQMAVASDGRTWVAAGIYGSVETSTDRRNWTQRYSGLGSQEWPYPYAYAAGYGAGTWVIAGTKGRVATSPDAIHWTRGGTGTPSDIFGVGFRPGQWMMVGAGGTIFSSENEAQWWIPRPSSTAANLYGVAGSPQRWVAVGDGGLILTSADGSTWLPTPSGTAQNLRAVAYDPLAPGDDWVAVGSGGTVLTSTDGLTWSVSASASTLDLRSVARDANTWVAVGPGGQGLRSATAASGTWTTVAVPGGLASVASDRVPRLACLPPSQEVGINQAAKLGAGGGVWPYTWSLPGSATGTTATGAFATPIYTALGSYAATVTDSAVPPATAECDVRVVPNPPPRAPPPEGVLPKCGYLVEDSGTAPGLYQWDEISATGMGVPGVSYYQSMSYRPTGAGDGFKFRFCGKEYGSFWLAGSGHICFSETPLTTGTVAYYYTNAPTNCGYFYPYNLPTTYTYAGKPAVFALWGLVNPTTCAGGSTGCVFVEVKGTAPERVLIYEFKDVPIGWGGPGQTFEIKLFEGSGCLQAHYKSVRDNPTYAYYGAAAGYQDATGVIGHEQFFHEAYSTWSHANYAWSACPFQARDDAYTFNEDQPEQVFDVTANDITGPPGYSVTDWSQPSKGTLSRLPGAGRFSYQPAPDQNGSDGFTYTLTSASGTVRKTAQVTLSINAVNDAPSFEADPGPIVLSPDRVARRYDGWGRNVAPAPPTATDEALQPITFQLASNSNPPLFAVAPALERIDATHQPTPFAGEQATLTFVPSGRPGTATLCFRPVDAGGDGVVSNTWLVEERGRPAGAERCGAITIHAGPVAFFEPSSRTGDAGQAITFDPCPRAIPDCSHDPDGALVQYMWEFGDGATSSLEVPRHAYDKPGRYGARLTVWDDDGNRATYEVPIVVGWGAGLPEPGAGAGGTDAPVADAGADRTVLEGALVQLSGSAQGGDEQTLLEWRQVAGPDVVLLDSSTPSPSFTAPRLPGMEPMELVFSLRATRGAAAGPTDYVIVRVASANRLPDLRIDGSRDVVAGSAVTLDASATLDADGDTLGFSWAQLGSAEGPGVRIEDPASPLLAFDAPDFPTVLRFRLTVSDGKAEVHDTVEVAVRAQPTAAGPPAAVEAQRDVAPLASPARASDVGFFLMAGALFVLAAVGAAAWVLRRSR